MALIGEKDRKLIEDRFKTLVHPVKIINFTQEFECDYCRETRQLLEEVSSISDKISFEVYNFVTDKSVAEKYKIDKIPATIVMGEKDYGLRFYGIPAGYEFSSLLEDIIAVSRKESGLSEKTRGKLKEITKPVHMQVFVTPT